MQAKIIQLLAQYLLIPLIKELFTKVIEWIGKKLKRKEVERENRETQRKVEDYENSSPDDAFDAHP